MPQAPVLDPRLFAVDPGRISQGALQAFQVIGERDHMKAFQAQQAEQTATRDARIAQTKALSDMAVLQANQEKAISDKKLAATLASLGLETATAEGGLKDLAPNRELAGLKRELDTKATKAATRSFESDKKLASDAKKAEIEKDRAMAANYWAEAGKQDALAHAAGVPPDKATEQWEKAIGDLAGITGKTPIQTRQLFASGALNEDGIPLSSELAALAENLKKPEFWKDPYEKISPSLKDWLGQGALQKIGTLAPNTGTKKEEAGSETPGVIKVDKDGNVIRPSLSADKPKAAQSGGEGVSGADVAAGAGLAALGLASSPGARDLLGGVASKAGKLAKNTWTGRSAAGQFTGKGLNTLPQRSLAQFARGGITGAAGPVAAAYGANQLIGGALSDQFTGDLTAVEGLAKAATTDSFDTQLVEAKFDELTQRINRTINSGALNDDQKMAELEKLINEREIVWSMISGEAPAERRSPAVAPLPVRQSAIVDGLRALTSGR